MKLLVIVLCLLSERFLIHSLSYKRFAWFNDYYELFKPYLDKTPIIHNSWLLLFAVIAPIVLTTGLLYLLFSDIFYGLVGVLFSLVLFFYCLGPQNVFYPSMPSDIGTVQSDEYLAQANTRLFAVVFWYLLTGPIGVLSYRLISLCKNIDSISSQACLISDILEWIPARITVLLYLLVGNFQRGFTVFYTFIFANPQHNHEMLKACGMEAVHVDGNDEIPLTIAESLVEQATIVFLVLIALCTLASWL